MSQRTLHIEIAGGPRTGKTTFAQWLSRILEDRGFQVSVNDPDIDGISSHTRDIHEKLWALKEDGLHIVIHTSQVARREEEVSDEKG